MLEYWNHGLNSVLARLKESWNSYKSFVSNPHTIRSRRTRLCWSAALRISRLALTLANWNWLFICGGREMLDIYIRILPRLDRLCGLVVRVPGYRFRGPAFDSQRHQIFWEIVGLERGPLSLVTVTEELLEWKSSGSGFRKSRLSAVGICCADHATPSISKIWH
jgi:hypothetical protein